MLAAAAALFTLCAPAARAESARFPAFTGWVVDEAHALPAPARAGAEAIAARLDREGLAQLAVVVVAPEDLGDDTRPEYAVELFRRWKLGHAKKQSDGLLLLFVAGPRGHRGIKVEVGYDLEGILPDGKVGALIDRHAGPHLRKGDFGAAALDLSGAFAQVIEAAGPQGQPGAGAPRRFQWYAPGLIAFAALLAAVAVLLLSYRWGRIYRTVLAAPLLVALAADVACFIDGKAVGIAVLLFVLVLGMVAWFLAQRACPRCGGWILRRVEPLGRARGDTRRMRATYECERFASGACDYRRINEYKAYVGAAPDTWRDDSTGASPASAGGSGGSSTSSSFGGGGGGESGGGGADREY